jgi:hypothetical protein
MNSRMLLKCRRPVMGKIFVTVGIRFDHGISRDKQWIMAEVGYFFYTTGNVIVAGEVSGFLGEISRSRLQLCERHI